VTIKTKSKQYNKTCMGCFALRVIFPCCHEDALGTASCTLGRKIRAPSIDGGNYRTLLSIRPIKKCNKQKHPEK